MQGSDMTRCPKGTGVEWGGHEAIAGPLLCALTINTERPGQPPPDSLSCSNPPRGRTGWAAAQAHPQKGTVGHSCPSPPHTHTPTPALSSISLVSSSEVSRGRFWLLTSLSGHLPTSLSHCDPAAPSSRLCPHSHLSLKVTALLHHRMQLRQHWRP